MDIDWNDESQEHSASSEHEEQVSQASPSTPLTSRPLGADRRGFYMTYVTAVAAVVLVVAILGVGFVFGHYVVKPSSPLSSTPSFTPTSLPSGSGGSEFPGFGGSSSGEAPSLTPSGGTTTSDPAAAKIAKGVDPGLVDINTNITYQDASAAGTGMILTSNGLILTNNHVIEGSTSITARDIATNKTYTAKVVGYDLSKDVAVLKLENASGLTTVSLGNSNDVKADEKIVGIGNAGGVGGTPSYVAGTVVALNQSITADSDENPNGSESLSGLIETNAPIQPGDSGGPLVTTSGKVVGMDTAANSNGGSGFGFDQTTTATQAYSIPINTAITIAKRIEAGDASSTVHIGETAILGIEVGTEPSGEYGGISGEPTSSANGVTIASVMANTPAANAGLVEGDVITSFDGKTVTASAQLSALEYSLKVGQKATITYVNQSGTTSTVSFALVSGPPQ